MMPTMKREQFEEMSFEELLEWAYDNIDDIHSEETLLAMVKHEINEDSLRMALHILQAVYESDCPDGSYYIYDRSMGTLETPTPITCKEDLEDYIDFEEDEEERAAERREAVEESLQQWHDRFHPEPEDFCDDPEVDEEYLAYYKKEGED